MNLDRIVCGSVRVDQTPPTVFNAEAHVLLFA